VADKLHLASKMTRTLLARLYLKFRLRQAAAGNFQAALMNISDTETLMRRFSLVSAIALALSAAAMVGPVQAAPYHLLHWDNTGVCQVWDQGWTMKPIRWPSNYEVVSKSVPTFSAALAVKQKLLKSGKCRF
jgi:hypothetical protein